jgi:hypothetical protein
MVPLRDRALEETLLAAGFSSLGEYRWFTSSLPLPDPSPASTGRDWSGSDGTPGSPPRESVQRGDV